MNGHAKQRTTLSNLSEPQQMRELNRQLTWIWDRLLGGLSMKSLNAEARAVIDSKAESETVDALTGRVTANESAIEQTPERIRLAVESVQIGGRNLFRNTGALRKADFTFDASGADAMGGCEEDGEGGFRVICEQENLRWWLGEATVVPGGRYAASVRYKIAAGNPPIQMQYLFLDADGQTVVGHTSGTLGKATVSAEGEWSVLSSLFTVPDNASIVSIRAAVRTGLDYAAYDCDYRVRRPKLETGDKATDWSPAPEDAEAAHAETKAELTAMSAQIESRVTRTEFDALGSQVASNHTAMTQTAEEIRSEAADSISGLETRITQNDEQIELLAGRAVGGTNLVSAVDATVTVGEVETVEDKYWAQSRTACRMDAFSEGYNIVLFPKAAKLYPGAYTLSFWSQAAGLNGSITVNCNLNNGKTGTAGRDVYFHYFTPATTPTRHSVPVQVNYEDAMMLRFVVSTPFASGCVRISDVKLERGDVATAWSPAADDPAYALADGSGFLMNRETIRATTKRFEVAALKPDGVTTQMRITGDGAVFDHLEAPNVAARYDGPAAVTVKPTATSAEMAAGGVYRSLADALAALSNRSLGYDVTISVLGDSYGMAELCGLCGSAHGLTITGNGHSIIGSFRAANCPVSISVSDLTFAWSAAGGRSYAANFDACARVNLNRCVVNGNGTTTGLHLAWGTRATAEDCAFYNVSDSLVIAGDNVDLTMIDAKGSGPYFIWTDGAVVKWQGTRPSGSWWQGVVSITSGDLAALTVDSGTETPQEQTIQTATWAATGADSYAGGYVNSWNYPRGGGNDDVYQGFTVDAGRIYGCIWFDNASIRQTLNGKTVKQAALRLTPRLYTGTGRAVDVRLVGISTAYASRSGAPTVAGTDYGVIGKLTPGQTVTATIPPIAAEELADGVIEGFALFSEDSGAIAGERYSANYARFDGMTSGDAGSRPALTVTYR